MTTRTFGLSPLWQHYQRRCEHDVLFEQDSFASRELRPPGWKGDQQEAEILQGPEQNEQGHRTSSISGFAIIEQESVYSHFSVSIIIL